MPCILILIVEVVSKPSSDFYAGLRSKNDFKSSHMPNQRMNLWRYSNGLFHIDEVRNLQLP